MPKLVKQGIKSIPLYKGSRKKILSLCDSSGNWSRPYYEAGYTVYQVDLKLDEDTILWPSKVSNEARLPDEFANIENSMPIYGILAAPLCTVFAGSGAKHPRLDWEIRAGLALVDACFRLAYVLKPVFFALENPVGKLGKWIGPPRLTFDPCDYGDPYAKRSCLWGHFNIPEKTPVKPLGVRPGQPSEWYSRMGGKSEKTKNYRSATPTGFAQAFFEANR